MNVKIDYCDGEVVVQSKYSFKNYCKSIISGKWSKKRRAWIYPETAIIDVIDVFKKIPEVKVTKEAKRLYESMKIREETVNKLLKGELKPRPHQFLMKHQRLAREIARYYPRFAFFLDTGTGKTVTSLQIIQDKATKFLVLCPKSIIKTAWWNDQKQFYPDMRLLPISRNMKKGDYLGLAEAWGIKGANRLTKQELKDKLMEIAQVYVINPESFKADLDLIKTLGVKGLVIDESTVIKNHSSQITKTVTKFAKDLEYVYILSGKPAPNGEHEYFSQMRIVDTAILGTSFYRFKNKYFVSAGYMGYDMELKPRADEEIADRIRRRAIFISKDECLDLPDKTYLPREVELPRKIKSTYLQMEKAQVVMLEGLLDKDKTITAPNKLASKMKLRQITSGFIFDETEKYDELHRAKIKELEAVLNEIGDKQAIIWINFKPEVEMITEMLKNRGATFVTAYSGTKDVDESISNFKEGKAQYIIAHPKTLKYGVTFTNCTYAIYYSLSYSYEDYYQSHDRIYRKGQTKPCTFIFLLAEGTIDWDIYKVLKEKGTVSQIIENLVKRVKKGG